MIVNSNMSIPVSGSVDLGTLATLDNRTVTVYIYMASTTCNLQSLYFNGYWKPEKSFPAAAADGLTNILFSSTPGTVARTAPVVGEQLLLVLIPLSNTACSITRLSVSVYLQP